jgi:hypothetical protein
MKVKIGPFPKKSGKRKIKVRIDDYDIWNFDHTVALIVLPMLHMIKEAKAGSPFVEDVDVPEEIRGAGLPQKNGTDEHYHARWQYVLDEMIFAFETKAGKFQDWEEKFFSEDFDFMTKELPNGNTEFAPTGTIDHEGMRQYQARISNGFRLFGKYYEGLWT